MGEKTKKHCDETLRIIFRAGSIERTHLAEKLSLSPIVVSQILHKLLQQQKIKIIGKGQSSGGRKPEIFSINPEWGRVIGLTFTSEGITSAIANPLGELENILSYRFSFDYTKTETLDIIYRAISEQIIYASKKNQRIFRIGIGMSGLVDEKLGLSINFPKYDQWHDVPLSSLIENKFSLKTSVVNHVTASTLAENIYGKYKHIQNLLYFHLGAGLGMGIIVNGEVYRGARVNIGEFGHTTVGNDNNRICYCGSYGCLEGVASAEAMIAEIENALRDGAISRVQIQNISPAATQPVADNGTGKVSATKIEVGAIFAAAASGDRLAYQIVERTARYLGIGIANMVNIFAPEIIILGGLMVDDNDLMIDLIKRNLKSRALQRIGEDLEVEKSSFGKNQGIMGAISLAWFDLICRA